jgi:hypothetical protein
MDAVLVASPAAAGSQVDGRVATGKEGLGMDKYLIESPHALPNCTRMLKELAAMGYLYHFHWGCNVGVHVGWAIVEAESEAHARLMVPPLVRDQARVVKLNQFDPDEVAALHDDRGRALEDA